MSVRNIKKQLAGEEDLLLGYGTEDQERHSGIKTITKISITKIVDTTADMLALDTTKYLTCNVLDTGRIFHYDSSKVVVNNGLTIFSGWVLQGNLTVDTVDELIDLGVEDEGRLCIVKDTVMGGNFIYTSSEVSNDDQGTNFKGCVRQYIGQVSVDWFGGDTQKAINSRNGILFNKGNKYITSKITSPINLNNDGFKINGSGMSLTDPIAYPTARERTSTVLVWDNPTPDTMFEFTDTLGISMGDMTLHGRDIANILVHFKMISQGSGVSKFFDISLYNASTLFRFASSSSDGTCADILFDHIQMTNATYGIEVLNYQGLNYNFIQPSANNVESVIRMTQGNSLNISMANFVGCGNDANGNYSIHIENAGDNAFNCLVNTIRFEQDCENFFYGENYGVSVINGLTEAQSTTTTNKIKLIGHSLTINDSTISSWDNLVDMIQLSAKRPSIHFNNTYFRSIKTFKDIKDMYILDTNTRLYISMINCKVNQGSGRPEAIKDFYSSLLLGEVVHEVTISGNSVPGIPYLFGESGQNQYNTLELLKGYTKLKTEISAIAQVSGDVIAATLIARVYWDGSAVTVLSSSITDMYASGVDTFNTATYSTSLIGCRLNLTNPSTGGQTWDYTCTTSIL